MGLFFYFLVVGPVTLQLPPLTRKIYAEVGITTDGLRTKVTRLAGKPSSIASASCYPGSVEDNRSNGLGQQSSSKQIRSWKDVGGALPKQWRPVKKPVLRLESKPFKRPLPYKRTAAKNAAICRAFPGLTCLNATSSLYQHVVNPGDLKPGLVDNSDSQSIATTIISPLTEANLRRHNQQLIVRPQPRRNSDGVSIPSFGSLPSLVGPSEGSDDSSSESSGSSDSSVEEPVWQLQAAACEGAYGNPEVRKYAARLVEYSVPVGLFRGFWRSELADSTWIQRYGVFFKGNVVRVRLPEAVVCQVQKYWAHTLHDNKLESFLVSVTKTKSMLSEVHFHNPNDEVLAALYIPVYCYVARWSEQQALNSIVRETAKSRSWFWAVPSIVGTVCVGLAIGHIAVPVMATLGVVSGICTALGVKHDMDGLSLNSRFVPLDRLIN